jgi:hypothetical protein
MRLVLTSISDRHLYTISRITLRPDVCLQENFWGYYSNIQPRLGGQEDGTPTSMVLILPEMLELGNHSRVTSRAREGQLWKRYKKVLSSVASSIHHNITTQHYQSTSQQTNISTSTINLPHALHVHRPPAPRGLRRTPNTTAINPTPNPAPPPLKRTPFSTSSRTSSSPSPASTVPKASTSSGRPPTVLSAATGTSRSTTMPPIAQGTV